MVAPIVLSSAGYAFTLITGLYAGNALVGDVATRAPLTFVHEFSQADLKPGATGGVTDLPLAYRLLALLPTLVLAVATVMAGWIATRILGGIRRGEAFQPDVVRGWPRLAWVLLLGAVVNVVAQIVVFAALNAYFTGPSPAWRESYGGIGLHGLPDALPWTFVLLGVIASALGAAFRKGARLQEDVAGVI